MYASSEACAIAENLAVSLQGIKDISVQSSVSLQHLPYDVTLETGLPKEIESKLSFATQKLKEIVKAKTSKGKAGSLTNALPEVGEYVSKIIDSGLKSDRRLATC